MDKEWQGVSGNALEPEIEEWHGIEEDGKEWHGIEGEEYEEWYSMYGQDNLDLSGNENFPDYAALVNMLGKEDDNEFNQDPIDVLKHADPFQDD